MQRTTRSQPAPPLNKSAVRPERLARLRKICLALPDATEKVAWGDPTWRVRDRIFAMQKGNYDGGRPSVWFKAPEGVQQILVEGEPDRFFVPPYVGSKGWVGVYLDIKQMHWPVLADLIEQSHGLIARPRARAAARTKSRRSRG